MSDEAHFSAEQSGPRAAARLPSSQRDGRRPQGAERAPRARPQEAQRLVTLSEARRLPCRQSRAGARRCPASSCSSATAPTAIPPMRIGFTVTKKIGNAVVRNRMKRRLRALAREICPAQRLCRRRSCADRPRRRDRARFRGARRRTRAGALEQAAPMIARLLIWLARGWQLGPFAGPAAELPLTSRAARPMRSPHFGAMGPPRAAGWRSSESSAAIPGAARARPGSLTEPVP